MMHRSTACRRKPRLRSTLRRAPGRERSRLASGRIAAALSAAVLSCAALLLWSASAPAAVRVLTPRDVLDTSTVLLDGELYLVQNGSTVRLITDPYDPEIANSGDGVFYTFPVDVVKEALAALDQRFTTVLDYDVVILPYPRSGKLGSTAENGVIYLSPGVRPIDSGHVHFYIGHEVGHIVHQQLLPDSHTEGWGTYRELRGIQAEDVYYDEASHANRPHEIFAEDFRQLYGGSVASDFPQENQAIASAGNVPGLHTFFESVLPDPSLSAAASPLVFGPNPFHPGQQLAFRWPGTGEHQMEIVDIQGRHLVAKTFRVTQGDGFTWLWDGRDDHGQRLPGGVYFVRLKGDNGATAVGRIVLVD